MINPLTLRFATHHDVHWVYYWRNHPEIRSNSLFSYPIKWQIHKRWFYKTLSSSSRILLIAMLGYRRVGVLRFDVNQTHAEVSIFLSTPFIGRGLGSNLIDKAQCWAKRHLPFITSLSAKVLKANRASQKIFTRHGFVWRGECKKGAKEFYYFYYSIENKSGCHDEIR